MNGFSFLEQPFNYYQAFNLYKNIEIRERIKRTLNRLEELMQLQDNWDGYGALKIEREAYENCKIYRPRNEGDSIAGYAQITAREVRQSSIESITTEVTSHPSKRNPFHAGISYTSGAELIKGHCMRPDFLIVTSTLALRCTFIPFDQ